MTSGVQNPQVLPAVQAAVASIDAICSKDSPWYLGSNAAMMIGDSGTVAANANVGNLVLGTALDAVYGPTNNGCPGIWIFLPATALAAPNNVAGWYWCVMSSTTVGTAYAISFSPGVASQLGTAAAVAAGAATPAYPPGILVAQQAGGTGFVFSPTQPSGTLASLPAGQQNATLVPAFPDPPPPALVVAANIATGTGAGYTGATTEQAAASYQLQGGAVGPAGSAIFEGVISAFNSAGAKTARGRVHSAATLAGGTAVVTQALTTGISALIARTVAMWDGHQAGTTSGTTNAGKFVTAGSVPTFFTLDESGGAAGTTPMYAGITLQVAVATDWLILQGHYLTGNTV
jgi:hypothetical protein